MQLSPFQYLQQWPLSAHLSSFSLSPLNESSQTGFLPKPGLDAKPPPHLGSRTPSPVPRVALLGFSRLIFPPWGTFLLWQLRTVTLEVVCRALRLSSPVPFLSRYQCIKDFSSCCFFRRYLEEGPHTSPPFLFLPLSAIRRKIIWFAFPSHDSLGMLEQIWARFSELIFFLCVSQQFVSYFI